MTTQDKASPQGVTLRDALIENKWRTLNRNDDSWQPFPWMLLAKWAYEEGRKSSRSQPPAPEQASGDVEIEQLIRERDHRDEIIDRLCDAVLGDERHEWSSAYGFDDAVADVEERINQLHQPSVDRAWARFEQANSQPAAPVAAKPEPQAQAGERTCGACGKSGCVAGECNDLDSLRKPTEQSLSDQLSGAVDCLEAGIFWDDGSIEKLLRLAIEAIAKRDAALQACVDAMDGPHASLLIWANAMRNAICQAAALLADGKAGEEARK